MQHFGAARNTRNTWDRRGRRKKGNQSYDASLIISWLVRCFLGARVALCRTLADGVRTAMRFDNRLKLKRFGHVGRDGQSFFFII